MKEIHKILSAFVYPAIFATIIWGVKIVESLLLLDFHTWGVYPLSVSGLKGIIFSPLIHGSYQHLISNTLPIIILGWALFYFYKNLGLSITLLAWLITGVWVWVFARESYHIGASGVIYSWAAFLFVSGVIRKHPRLMALSLLVAFLYGSLIWGVFPLREKVSWEGHLMGMLSGVVLALFFRESGPKRKMYSWELEEELEEDTDVPPYWMKASSTEDSHNLNEEKTTGDEDKSKTPEQPSRVKYIYTPRPKSGNQGEH